MTLFLLLLDKCFLNEMLIKQHKTKQNKHKERGSIKKPKRFSYVILFSSPSLFSLLLFFFFLTTKGSEPKKIPDPRATSGELNQHKP